MRLDRLQIRILSNWFNAEDQRPVNVGDGETVSSLEPAIKVHVKYPADGVRNQLNTPDMIRPTVLVHHEKWRLFSATH